MNYVNDISIYEPCILPLYLNHVNFFWQTYEPKICCYINLYHFFISFPNYGDYYEWYFGAKILNSPYKAIDAFTYLLDLVYNATQQLIKIFCSIFLILLEARIIQIEIIKKNTKKKETNNFGLKSMIKLLVHDWASCLVMGKKLVSDSRQFLFANYLNGVLILDFEHVQMG